MALRREVYDAVDVVLGHESADGVEVADVGSDEGVVGSVLYVPEVGEVARVGEFVEVDDVVVGVLVDEEPHHVAADESSSAGNQDITFECCHDDVCV